MSALDELRELHQQSEGYDLNVDQGVTAKNCVSCKTEMWPCRTSQLLDAMAERQSRTLTTVSEDETEALARAIEAILRATGRPSERAVRADERAKVLAEAAQIVEDIARQGGGLQTAQETLRRESAYVAEESA